MVLEKQHKLKLDSLAGGQDNNLLYLSGIPHTKVLGKDIINKVVELVEKKVKDLEK